jgi:hypothetical protein
VIRLLPRTTGRNTPKPNSFVTSLHLETNLLNQLSLFARNYLYRMALL